MSTLSVKNTKIISIALGMLFACVDEFHQFYSLNRGPKLKDVFLDSFGVISGVMFASLLFYLGKKLIRKRGKFI